MHKYQFDYSEDTAAGRLVALLSAHARSGVVVDLGCGTAELAGPLEAAGFEYVGFDLDAEVVRTLVERGVDARVCDLTVDDPAAAVEAALAGRTLAAITAIDVIEHVPGFDRLLAALSVELDRHGALLGVSIPNVVHHDLAVKLLAGRWDVTDIGLLDSTHINLFDEQRLMQTMCATGFAEVARSDVDLPRSEQSLLLDHPYVYAHTAVGEWLRHLRAIAGPHATTYQFVRVYRAAPAGAPYAGTAPVSSLEDPTFTVIVLPGSEADVATTIAALGAQTRPAEELRVAPDTGVDEWFVESLTTVSTTHACLVEAGHVVPSEWLQGFAAALEHYPERVARHPVAATSEGGQAEWGLLRTLSMRDEPLAAFAVPVAPSSWLQLADDDGPEALWAWVVRTASLVGLVDVVAESPLAAVDRRDNSELLQLLGAEALLMPVGWHHEVAVNRSVVDRLEAELAAERRRADVATAAYEEIRDAFWWRVTGPARRFKDWLRARLPL